MCKEAVIKPPLSAFDKSIFTMFFLNLKKYVKLKLTFVMAVLFTLAPIPPPPSYQTIHSTEAKFLDPD